MTINIKSSFKPQFRKSISNIFRDIPSRTNIGFTWFDSNFMWYDVEREIPESIPSRTNVGFTWFDSNFMWYDVEREIPESIPSRTNLLTGEDAINKDM